MERVELSMRKARQPLAATAVLINALLIFLICVHSSKLLGVYKYLMIYIAVFEMSYASLEFLHIPVIFSQGSACFLMIELKNSHFPVWFSTALNVAFYWFFGATLITLNIHFVYRYAAVSGSSLLGTFQSWKLIIWFTLPLLSGAVWVFDACVLFRRTEQFDKFLDENYIEANEWSYFGVRFYPNAEDVNWKSVTGVLIIFVLIVFSISTIVYYGVKCFWAIQSLVSHSSESLKSKRLQQQLFYALVAQTLIPMVLLHSPSSVLILSLIFDRSQRLFGLLLSTSTAFYPAINPIPTIFIVESYRKALFKYITTAANFLFCGMHQNQIIDAPEMTITQITRAPDS